MLNKNLSHQLVLVLDFDAYSQLVARRIRNAGVYCEILPWDASVEKIKEKQPIGLVLVGELTEENAAISKEVTELGVPVLEINGENKQDQQLLHDFLYETCGARGDWQMGNVTEEIINDLRAQIGEQKVVVGMSGGVDSTVTAALLSRAIGKQLTCVLVDHGFMRLNEISEVVETFKANFDANLKVVDASEQFLTAVKGVRDPEQKRKIIGSEFIKVFEQVAKEIGEVDLLAQGTIYPDVVESGTKTATLVKSHHNVGGLPEVMDFKGIIEPLRALFKDEVRQLGSELGLPEEIVWRQPFPGPGLAIRVIGDLTKEKLDLLRGADAIFREEIFKANLHRELSQYFAVLTDTKAVGAMSDKRTYEYVLALRAVQTDDFMTAAWARIPFEVLEKISGRIVNEVRGLNRITYDITTKPPATIEWE